MGKTEMKTENCRETGLSIDGEKGKPQKPRPDTRKGCGKLLSWGNHRSQSFRNICNENDLCFVCEVKKQAYKEVFNEVEKVGNCTCHPFGVCSFCKMKKRLLGE